MKPLSDMNDEQLIAELQRSRQLQDAPEAVIQRALDLFQARVQAPAAPTLMQRALASLSFDSAAEWLPAHGIRGSASSSRQLLFSAEERDIDLRVMPADSGPDGGGGCWVVFGQLLGPDRSGRVELSCGDESRQVALDDMLEFRFDGVPGGSVRLTLHLDGLVIELPQFDIPRPGSP